jgi:serine/threonine-protein kinase
VALRDQDGMAMVFVPAGDFIMGSLLGIGSDEEAPQHRVTLGGYWIDEAEVTNAQYRAFVDATGYPAPALCKPDDLTYTDPEKTDHPVVCVSWDDAQAYCAWAGGRLPTEAEWEKAARGLDQRNYPWGNRFDGSRANYCDVQCELDYKDSQADDGYARTAPVGSYPAGASPFGALDMAGNVWEWVGDWYSFSYYGRSPEINPQGPGIGEERVLRGGAWSAFSENLRSAYRAWLAPGQGDRAIGFRCVVPTQPVP